MDAMQLLVSAALSLVTGYIGGSLSESRRRRLERRTMLRALSVEIGDIAETCDRTHFRMNSFVTDHSVGEPLPRSNLSSNDWAKAPPVGSGDRNRLISPHCRPRR